MRRNTIIAAMICIAMTAAVCSCDKYPVDIDGIGNPDSNDGKDHGNDVTPVVVDTVVFVSALAFPEGYDWQRDSSYGHVSASVLLFRNGEETVRIGVGSGMSIPTNASWHLIQNGHLYTGWCTEKGTFVMRDDKTVLEYDNPEIIRGILIEDDTVYTLGQDRKGKGVRLRKNGKELFSDPEGTIFGHLSSNQFYSSGALYRDNGKLCFCFYRGQGDKRTWYVCIDGKERIFYPGKGEVVDVRVIDAEIYHVLKTDNEVRLFEGNSQITIRSLAGDIHVAVNSMDRCMIGRDSEGLFAFIRYRGDFQDAYGIWRSNGMFTIVSKASFLYSDDEKPEEWKVDRNTYSLHIGEQGGLSISNAEKQWQGVSGGTYYFTSFRNACQRGKSLYVGTTPTKGHLGPLLWENGKMKEFGFNGFITGVWVQTVQR